jgi:hypothetical protein
MKFINRLGKSTIIILATFFLIFTAGCSAKFGSFEEKSHFAFPNSNVKPLGQVSVEKSKTSFIIPPSLDAADVRELLGQALQQKAGADLVINYKVDTKITVIPIPIFSIFTLTMSLSGTAVSMEVGEKELMETIKQVGY